MAIKLNKANAMMSKLGQVFDIKSLKSVYYAIYLSPMYAMLVLHEHQKLIGLKDFIYYKNPHQFNVLSQLKSPHKSFI